MDQEIADYIRANRDTYTREALRQRLIESGFPDEVVDAELDAAEGARPARRDMRWRAAGITFLFGLALIGLEAIVIGGADLPGAVGFSAMFLGPLLICGYLFALLFIYMDGDLERGAEGAVIGALVIPFVILFGIFGACAVTTKFVFSIPL